MMRFIFVFAFVYFFNPVHAQQVIDVNQNDHIANSFFSVGGEPVQMAKFVGLKEGTPFFKEEWLNSSIVLSNGNTYKNIVAKVNLLENTIHYKDARDNEMIATIPIREVVLYNEVADELYRFINSNAINAATKKGWYLWLYTGKASLYKYFTKTLIEQKPYGSATTEQVIKTKAVYYILYNNTWFKVSKLKEVPDVLANQKAALQQYISGKINSNHSLDDQMEALLAYYNSLQ
jgi:hypothetical protein